MSLSTLSPGKNVPEELNVVIEITPQTGRVKYELDKDTGMLSVDRFMATTMIYPCLYGYVPNTLAEDGDPLDVLVLSPEPVLPGTLMTARPIAVLEMEDEAGGDAKILALPTKKACPQYAHLNSLEDIPSLELERIAHFFSHYKDLEKNKWVKVGGWEGQEVAFQIIRDAVARHRD
jgi:inorganic pyrophosphatase